jgi:hypothetical protein
VWLVARAARECRKEAEPRRKRASELVYTQELEAACTKEMAQWKLACTGLA